MRRDGGSLLGFARHPGDVLGDFALGVREVVVTHGNGPQVGDLLVKNEIAATVVPPVPLDWCGAQTQGTIGFTILDALEPALARPALTAWVGASRAL